MADIEYSAEFKVSLEKLKKAFIEAQGDVQKFAASVKDIGKTVQTELDKGSAGASKFGDLVGNYVPGNLKKMVFALQGAGGAAKTLGMTLQTALGIFGLVSMAVTQIIAVVGKAAEAYNKHNLKVKEAAAAQAILSGDVNKTEKALRDYDAALLRAEGSSAKVESINKRLIESYKSLHSALRDINYDLRVGLVDERTAAEQRLNLALREQSAAMKAVDDANQARIAAEEKLAKTQQFEYDAWTGVQLQTKAWTDAKKAVDDANAALITARTTLRQHTELVEELRVSLEALPKETEKEGKALKEELSDQEKINIARNAAQEKYSETIKRINEQLKTGRLTEEEGNKQRDQAMATWADDLRGIVDQYNLTEGITVKLLDEKEKIVGLTATELRNAEERKKAEEERKKAEEKEREEAERYFQEELAANNEIDQATIRRLEAEGKLAEAAALEREETIEALYARKDLTEAEKERLELLYKETWAAEDAAKIEEERKKSEEKRIEAEKKAAADRKDAADAMFDVQTTLKQQEIDRLKRQASLLDAGEAQNRLLNDAAEKERELIRETQDRALEEFKLGDAYKAMVEAGDGSAEKYEEAWNKATENMVAAVGTTTKKAEDHLKDLSDHAGEIAQEAMSLVNSALSLNAQLVAQDVETQIQEIDSRLEEETAKIEEETERLQEELDRFFEEAQERLEKEREMALEAAGLRAATNEENLEAAMDAALASMDAAVIYAEQQRQKELAINREYDAKEKALAEQQAAEQEALEVQQAAKQEAVERQAAQTKIELQYRADMAEWQAALVEGAMQIPMAILKAWGQGGPIVGAVLAAIAAAAGTVQMAALMASMPKKQSLASGGIVEGSGVRGVDSVETMLAPREMVLNDEQQSNLFGMIAAGQAGSQKLTLITILEVNGQVMAQTVTEAVNDGYGQLINRARLA